MLVKAITSLKTLGQWNTDINKISLTNASNVFDERFKKIA
jgi:hypothetical protein